MRTEANSDDKGYSNALLTEYQACVSDSNQLDADIWASSYVFLGYSVIGLSIYFTKQVQSWLEFLVFINGFDYWNTFSFLMEEAISSMA